MSIDNAENIERFMKGDIPLMAEMLERSLISSVNVRDSKWSDMTALMDFASSVLEKAFELFPRRVFSYYEVLPSKPVGSYLRGV